jgi:hypothetical protein
MNHFAKQAYAKDCEAKVWPLSTGFQKPQNDFQVLYIIHFSFNKCILKLDYECSILLSN